MRVRSSNASLTIAPGEHADLVLDVANTGGVIDGITARVVGLAETQVSSSPAVLPLFPDATGRITLTIGMPRSFPAGRHQTTIAVSSRQPGIPPEYVDLEIVVPEVPSVSLSSRPQLIRTRRTGRFLVTVANRGNVGLDVNLAAGDPERALGVVLKPAVLTVAPAAGADVYVVVKAPRYLVGSDLDRPLTVTAAARPIGSLQSLPAPDDSAGPIASGPVLLPEPEHEHEGEADPEDGVAGTATEPITAAMPITLRHRPWVTRGVLTAMILLAIIGGWAAVFLFGIGQVFAGDPLTKSAPASFFASAKLPGTGPTLAADTGPEVSGSAGASAVGVAPDGGGGNPPGGALPKGGAMPTGVGGTLTGTVRAASDNSAVGRILVEALRIKSDGGTENMASAATQADGSYSIPGLFPGIYQVRFTGSGFVTLTRKPSLISTQQVNAGLVTSGIDAVIAGRPASINGSIDAGGTQTAVTATVTVTSMSGPRQNTVVATTKTDATGRYALNSLAAPEDYQITVQAKGFQPSVVQTNVLAGATRYQPAIPIAAGPGRLAGTVSAQGQPLGGVTVTTAVNGKTITSGTPTTGLVGHFDLGNVPTPATYVLTFSLGGYGTTTEVVDLGPGQNATTLSFILAKGTGTVSGRLVDPSGAGLGGAVITVGGLVNPPTSTTLTVGTVGSFGLDGLPSPGSYTLTFTLAGYTTTTVPLVLTSNVAPPPLNVVMSSALGQINGQVFDSSGEPVVDAAVVATDGSKKWTVSSTPASGGSPAGGFVLDKLPAGIYTVTATSTDGTARTILVTVTAGRTGTVNFPLPGAG